MGTSDLLRKGKKVELEEKLNKQGTNIQTYWEALQVLNIQHKFKPAGYDVSKLRVLCPNWIAAIEEYQEIVKEIEQL